MRWPLLPIALAALAVGCARRTGSEDSSAGTALVLPEHYAHSIAALGFPGATRAFQVGHGSVISTGETALEWTMPRAAAPPETSPVWFEDDEVPVAHWWMRTARESLAFEAAAIPEPALGATGLVLSVRVTAAARLPEAVEVDFEARVRGRPSGPGFVAWDADDDDSFDESWDERVALRNGRAIAGVDPVADLGADPPSVLHPAHSVGFGPGALTASCRATVAPGQTRSWDFWMPAQPAAPQVAARLAHALHHEQVVTECRRAWRGRLASATRLETPDSLANHAWRAALVTLIQCQERAGDGWAPIGNPFQYRDVWIRDGARVVRALAVAGLTGLARADARTLLAFQLPSGALLSQRGQLDGTGQALWALEQAAAIPPHGGWAREVLPEAAAGLGWIQAQREGTRALKLPWRGLLPFAEPRDNELTRAQLVGNDGWAYAGCRAVGTLARLAGRGGLAKRADSAAADARGTLLAALRRSGHPDLPASWQGGGRDWGNLALGYPTHTLPPGDARIARLAKRLRSEAAPGLVTSGGPDSLHGYVGMDLAQSGLHAGRGAEARDALASLLAHSSSTLGQAEVESVKDGSFGANLPPHATASAALVDLMRNMIASDFSDTLALALGASAAWWEGTRLVRAPTRFGVIDVTLGRAGPDRLEARWSPVGVPARVRVPDGLRAVAVVGSGAKLARGGWIECPRGASSVKFQVASAGARR